MAHTSGAGWMTMTAFSVYIKWLYSLMIERGTIPSKESPFVLLVDNHSSRFHPKTLIWARERHLHIWTLLPNSTSIAQPLDATSGPFCTLKVIVCYLCFIFLFVPRDDCGADCQLKPIGIHACFTK